MPALCVSHISEDPQCLFGRRPQINHTLIALQFMSRYYRVKKKKYKEKKNVINLTNRVYTLCGVCLGTWAPWRWIKLCIHFICTHNRFISHSDVRNVCEHTHTHMGGIEAPRGWCASIISLETLSSPLCTHAWGIPSQTKTPPHSIKNSTSTINFVSSFKITFTLTSRTVVRHLRLRHTNRAQETWGQHSRNICGSV